MIDNINFAVVDSNGKRGAFDYTPLGLLSFLFYSKLITHDNAYDVCNWLAHAEPRQEYNAGTFCIIALDY